MEAVLKLKDELEGRYHVRDGEIKQADKVIRFHVGDWSDLDIGKFHYDRNTDDEIYGFRFKWRF